MSSILIALDWEKYLYLYKYNSCYIAQSSLVEFSSKQIQSDENELSMGQISALEKSIPIFERDMDVVLLEYDKSKLCFESGIRLVFNGIHKIIPLSYEAQQMLSARVPQGIVIEKPLSERLLNKIKSDRNRTLRLRTVDTLLGIFDVLKPRNGDDFIRVINNGIHKIHSSESTIDTSSVLYNLFTFDITPSFIPEGNIESIIKLGCIVYRSKGSNIEKIREGAFFKACKRFESEINKGSILDGYDAYMSMIQNLNVEEKESIKKLESEIEKDFPYMKSLFVYYAYLSLNRRLSRHNFNIEVVHEDLIEIGSSDPESLFYILAIFGSIHSFERLYESIHKLSGAPLFESHQTPLSDEPISEEEALAKDSKSDNKAQNEGSQSKTDRVKSEGESREKKKRGVIEIKKSHYGRRSKVGGTMEMPFDEVPENVPSSESVSKLSANSANIVNEPERSLKSEKLQFDDFVTKVEDDLSLNKSETKLWIELKERIQALDEIKWETIEEFMQFEPFITKSGNPKAAAKRIKEAIQKNLSV